MCSPTHVQFNSELKEMLFSNVNLSLSPTCSFMMRTETDVHLMKASL